MRRIRWVLAAVVIVTAAYAYFRKSPQRFQVSLLADTTQIVPGRPFQVGVLVTLEPGSHIYWSNPGHAGAPTEIKLNLPKGLTAGEVQLPTPVDTVDPGNVETFGYTDSVMFIATVTPDATSTASGPLDLSATVSYELCDGNGTRTAAQSSPRLQLPVAAPAALAQPANTKLFSDWTSQIPSSADPNSVLSIRYFQPGGQVAIRYVSNDSYNKPEAFPANNTNIDVSGSSTVQEGGMGAFWGDVVLEIKPRPGHSMPTGKLPVVLGFSTYRQNRPAPTWLPRILLPLWPTSNGKGVENHREGVIIAIDLAQLRPPSVTSAPAMRTPATATSTNP